MKTLEELKAEANSEAKPEEEAEIELEPEEPESVEPEEVEEGEEEKPEEEEFGELELEGEPEASQHKPDPAEAIAFKIKQQRKRAQKAESEVDQLKRELKELKDSLKGGQAPVPQQSVAQTSVKEPQFPDMYDPGIDGDRQKYDAAVKKYFTDIQSYTQRHSEAAQQQEKYKQEIERKTSDLAGRVSRFAVEHKMKDDYVVNAVQRATEEIDSASGIEGAFAHLLDAVGEGSEKAAIYVGAKDHELEKVKKLLASDPSGLKAVSYLTQIANRKPAQRHRSKAPEPDQPIKGDRSSTSAVAKQLQKQYESAKGIHEMREIRKKAAERGVKLTT